MRIWFSFILDVPAVLLPAENAPTAAPQELIPLSIRRALYSRIKDLANARKRGNDTGSGRWGRKVMKPLVPAELTWCTFSPFDKIALGTLVRRAARPHCQMAEIGSWFGSGSTTVFLQELQEHVGSCLLCVDTWQGNPNVPRHQEIVSTFDVFGTFRANVSNAQSCVPVLELVSSSKAAARVVADKRFDLVFLDADHSYNSVREDIDFWRPKVRPGGILCGHDCEARMTHHLEQRIRDHLNVDSIAGDGPLFKEIHPGSILAVHEAFHGTASLFAEQRIVCPDGKTGHSSIWYAEVR